MSEPESRVTAKLLELTALLACWLCLSAWQRDRTIRGRRLFIAMCLAVFAWSAGALTETLEAVTPADVDRLAYLGILVVPPLWLALALVLRDAAIAERAPWALALLLAPGCGLYVLLYQDPAISAWFTSVHADGTETFGPLWWLNAGYAWTLTILGTLHFGWSARSLRERRDRIRRITVASLTAVPLVANVAYVAAGLPGLDPTPILLGAWLVLLRSELFSGDLLQALPIAQHDLLSQLPTPLILTDLAGRVTEINPAAQACLGVAKADALERNIEALLEDAAFAPEFDRWALVAQGREAGQILLPARAKPGGGGR